MRGSKAAAVLILTVGYQTAGVNWLAPVAD